MGDTIHVSGKLTDSNGNGIANKKIVFAVQLCTFNEQTMEEECSSVSPNPNYAYTDSNGNYSEDLSVPTTCASGYWYYVYAHFDGDNQYKPSGTVCKKWNCSTNEEQPC